MINYKQLYYFWCVAKYQGVTRAAEQLHLTPQTISGQLGELEKYFGFALFHRRGRRLELTPAGNLAYSHADEIFQVGSELEGLLKGNLEFEEIVFRVGISDVIPKSIAYNLLSPTQRLMGEIRLQCHEDKVDNLFSKLAIHKLDLVISDRPLPTDLGVKGFNHLLGESETAFYATPELAQKFGKGFPLSLNGAPMLFPSKGSALRHNLDRWLSLKQISPRIKAEFDDTALMKAFGQEGVGIFPAPRVIAEEITRQHDIEIVGETDELKLRYYAISAERKLRHPAVIAISETAQHKLFIK